MVNCPYCGSDDVKKASALHEQGTSTSQGTSKGVFATSSGGIGVGQSSFEGETSTLAAQRLAPPIDTNPLRALIIGSIVMFSGVFIANSFFGIIMWLLFTGLIMLVVVTIMLLNPSKGSEEALQDWIKRWYCCRCGKVFTTDEENDDQSGRRSKTQKSSHRSIQSFISPVVRAQTNHPRSLYIASVVSPVQRASELTDRDEAGIRAILDAADSEGSFEPRSIQLDLGVASRLASLNVIKYDQRSDHFIIIKP